LHAELGKVVCHAAAAGTGFEVRAKILQL
jgi:hypothetical protein